LGIIRSVERESLVFKLLCIHSFVTPLSTQKYGNISLSCHAIITAPVQLYDPTNILLRQIQQNYCICCHRGNKQNLPSTVQSPAQPYAIDQMQAKSPYQRVNTSNWISAPRTTPSLFARDERDKTIPDALKTPVSAPFLPQRHKNMRQC
jgi:hypothetical protein